MKRSIRKTWLALALGLGVLACGPAMGAPLVALDNGKVTARIAGVPLANLKSEVEAVMPVEIRIAGPEVANHPVTANVSSEGVAQALDQMLRDFNFVQFVDSRSGRAVYLVTSLADPNAPRTAPPVVASSPARTEPASASVQVAKADSDTIAAGKTAPVGPAGRAVAMSSGSSKDPRSLDELKPITPATYDAYAEQSIIDAETARVRQERLDRATSVLGNPAMNPELQRQALNELASIGDPKSTQMLERLINDNRVLDSPVAAEVVAQTAWRYAAQQQFANADANRLLQTMAQSTQPQMRYVGEAALRDSQQYLAKNKP